jgi:lipoprotein LprG
MSDKLLTGRDPDNSPVRDGRGALGGRGVTWQAAVMRQTSLLAAAAAALLIVTGCSSDDGDDTEPATNGDGDPQAQLDAAAELLNNTDGVRFTLDGEDLPDSGNLIVGAEGVAVPPASFEGDVRVIAAGLTTTIEVVSVDGDLWAKLPLTSDFAQVDAEALGFGDPGALIDPDRGVSRLLTSGSNVAEAGQARADGEVFEQVTSTLPGDLVADLFAVVDPDSEVEATWSLDPDTGHVRRAVLTGQFYDSGDSQTYTVTLDDYDQPVEISAPSD